MLKIIYLILICCTGRILTVSNDLLKLADISSSICMVDSKYWEFVNWIYGQNKDISLITIEENSTKMSTSFIKKFFSSIS